MIQPKTRVLSQSAETGSYLDGGVRRHRRPTRTLLRTPFILDPSRTLGRPSEVMEYLVNAIRDAQLVSAFDPEATLVSDLVKTINDESVAEWNV